MIKKYKEFIKESWSRNSLQKTSYNLDIPEEDIEDYFLRLIEIFDCEIYFSSVFGHHIDIHHLFLYAEKVREEVNAIKNRLEEKCKNITFFIHQTPRINPVITTLNFIYDIDRSKGSINESWTDKRRYNDPQSSVASLISLRSGIPQEELEDYFLRLEEVFKVKIDDLPGFGRAGVQIICDKKEKNEVEEEIKTIVNRIKYKFPKLKNLKYKDITPPSGHFPGYVFEIEFWRFQNSIS